MSTEVRQPEFRHARVLPPKPPTLAEEIVDAIGEIEDLLLHAREHPAVLPGPELMWVRGLRDGLVTVLGRLPTQSRQR